MPTPFVIDGTMLPEHRESKGRGVAPQPAAKWVFDPAKYNNGKVASAHRGVAYWKGAEGERIFDFVRDRVYAIDAKSGQLIQSFGKTVTSICGKTWVWIRRESIWK